MGKILSGKRHGVILAAALFLSAVLMAGCGGEKEEAKVRDLEELQEIIEQKKKEPFRLTYSGGEDLYIAAGYGEQKTGGYSIAVPELYLTENSITIRTELKGPEKQEQTGSECSYPFIVVKMPFMEEPVVFK